MAIGYRAILRLDEGQDAIDLAEGQLNQWLREKLPNRGSDIEAAVWQGVGVHHLDERTELHVVHDDYPSEEVRRRLYRLVESNSAGTFVVSTYAAALPGLPENNQTIVVEVEKQGVDGPSALNEVDPPRMVRALLDSIQIRDGRTQLSGKPIPVGRGDVKQVIRAILDPDRTASVIVAGSVAPEADDQWAMVIGSLTRQSVGVAAVFSVQADALHELDKALGPRHSVGAGRVRTYLPKVDLEDPSDSLRHKWLGPATLARSISGKHVGKELQRRHAEAARRRFVEAELPSDVRRTMGVLRRAETKSEREAKVAKLVAADQKQVEVELSTSDQAKAPSRVEPGKGHDWSRKTMRVLRYWLSIDQPEPAHLDSLDNFIRTKVADAKVAEEQLSQAVDQGEELEATAKISQSRAEDMELDLAVAEEDNIELQRELSALRTKLARSASPDTYIEPDPVEWSAPGTIEELVGLITPGEGAHAALKFVEFTGDIKDVLEVDQRYKSGLYAKTFWQYVRALHDYAQVKATGEFSGNVHMYLSDDTTEGTKCSPSRHAGTESDSVLNNTAWCEERVRKVPTSVDPDGTVLMAAHFKPTHRDGFAPRLHYYDDTAKTRKVYIGYIGKHLTNTQS